MSFTDYYRKIPENTFIATLGAGVAASLGYAISCKDIRIGLIHGALCGSATLIHGLVLPLFERSTENSKQILWS